MGRLPQVDPTQAQLRHSVVSTCLSMVQRFANQAKESSFQGDVRVHGQVRGDSGLPSPPPPGKFLERIFFACMFVWEPGGVRIIVAFPDESTSLWVSYIPKTAPFYGK